MTKQIEGMRVWTNDEELDRIRKLPNTTTIPTKSNPSDGVVVLYSTGLAKEQIIRILNNEI